jgi:hypothetical protein
MELGCVALPGALSPYLALGLVLNFPRLITGARFSAARFARRLGAWNHIFIGPAREEQQLAILTGTGPTPLQMASGHF